MFAFAWLVALLAAMLHAGERVPEHLVGYTELQTNLPGGRHANVRTMRAVVSRLDGSGRRVLADADGSHAVQVQTGQPFNFSPNWSPDGHWVLFLSGAHYNCHPHLVRADGAGLRKLADRGGYKGVVEFLDVSDFHGGSSDLPVWSADGGAVFYTAQVDQAVELFRVPLQGASARLSRSSPGTLHYHPQPSPDGKWLLYGSKRDGVRQLVIIRLADRSERRVTDLPTGRAAMWPHWQPRVPLAE